MAQSSAEHKTYSGAFPYESSGGKATYSYWVSESGERVFDGPFKYTVYYNDKKLVSYEGNFKNNRQIGRWTMINYPDHGPFGAPKTLVKTVTTVSFNENGLLDGAFKIQEYYRNGTVIDILNATYQNGQLNGPFKGQVKLKGDLAFCSGQYKNGKPAGLWTYSKLDFPVDFDDVSQYGYVIVKYINKATGDITEKREIIPTYLDKGKPFEWWLDNTLMRCSRMGTLNPVLPGKNSNSDMVVWKGGCELPAGFEEVRDEGAELIIEIPDSIPNNRDKEYYRNGWSKWEDFILCNCSLTPEEIGDKPVSVNMRIEVRPDGSIHLLKNDTTVSDRLNEETLRLLKMLKWNLALRKSNFSKTKFGMGAYCNVTVTYDPKKMDIVRKTFNESKQKYEDPIYERAEKEPQFPGGPNELVRFFSENFKMPADVKGEKGSTCRVIVKFIVRKDGSIKDIKILKTPHKSLSDEVIRLIESMPTFEPGTINGLPVNVWYTFTIPIKFTE